MSSLNRNRIGFKSAWQSARSAQTSAVHPQAIEKNPFETPPLVERLAVNRASALGSCGIAGGRVDIKSESSLF
jgi:hypothetical protein